MNLAFVLHIALMAAPAAPIEPSGGEKVTWGKSSAFVVADGLTFTIEGPRSVLFELWGDKGASIELSLVRDDAFVSKNAIKLKPKKGPAGYGATAAVGIEVPAGKHVYKVSAGGKKLAIGAKETKKLTKKQLVAAEVALSSPAAAAPATPIAAEPVEDAAEAAPESAVAAAAEPAPAATVVAASREVMATAADAGGAGALQAKRVAVYEMQLQEVPANVGKVVTNAVLAEVRKLSGMSAIGMDEIQDMLSHEANKQIVGCESNESCLAEIAGALGVDDLVSGSLSKVGENSVMVLRRIDQRYAKVVGSVNKRLVAGTGEEFLAAIGPAIEELFPERQLRAGAERGVPKEMALRLNPPPLPSWTFYTVSGAAVVAAAVGGVFALLAQDAEQQANSYAQQGLKEPIQGSQLVGLQERATDRAFYANIGYGTAGGLALTAAIMWLFTDFEGYGEQQ